MIKNKVASKDIFSHWEVITVLPGYKVRARCVCGVRKTVQTGSLVKGYSRSCGCKKNIKHGQSRSFEYKSWTNMIQRCTNPKRKDFKDYGARGIKVCDRWLNSFVDFFSDIGVHPKNTTLDRERVDGDYEPGNCRWISRKEQMLNRRKFKAEQRLMNYLITWVKKGGTLGTKSNETGCMSLSLFPCGETQRRLLKEIETTLSGLFLKIGGAIEHRRGFPVTQRFIFRSA